MIGLLILALLSWACGVPIAPQDTDQVSARKRVASVSVTPDTIALDVNDVGTARCQPRNRWGVLLTNTCTWVSRKSAVATVPTTSAQTIPITARTTGITWVVATVNQLRDSVKVCVNSGTTMPCIQSGPPIDPPCLNTVNVATTAELNTALASASPGDCIVMAAGTYTGTRVVTVSGTASNPIKLSGPATAIIGGTGLAASAINFDLRGNYWIFDGFTITNAYQPFFIQGGHDNIVRNLTIYNIGQEALHIKASAHHNTVDGCNIHDTGKTNPSFGEGVYVGSGGTGAVDHADFNTIQNCTIGPNISAQMVDLKEGTTGSVVQNNTFDGAGSSTNQDAWVNVYGNQSQILNNVGSKARVYGYKNEVLVAGWGESNEFKGNTLTLDGGAWGSATGPGFRVGGGAPAATVVLWCPPSNTVTGGTGFSNISCNAN